MVWDADFRYTPRGWQHWSFHGSRRQRILVGEQQKCLKNAYRVLLTRARQGMVVVVPPGDDQDPTRTPAFYDETFGYLCRAGMALI